MLSVLANWAEPVRQNGMEGLQPYLRARVVRIMQAMRARGFDPVLFETRRTVKRQLWLIDRGRSWTRWSKHLTGKAADIVSRRNGKLTWEDAEFYRALGYEAAKEDMHQLAEIGDYCHIEWRG